jgi:crossover junction endodeoxyribonuclease RuvC
MRILGIDPGSSVTGYGVVARVDGELEHVASGTLRPPRNASLPVRLHFLYMALEEVIRNHRPDVAVVEQVFVATSPRAALVLGQARGVALAALAAGEVGVSEYAATSIKQAVTGSGRAPKSQVQRMVRRLLALDSTPASDAADALAAAICHAHASRILALGGGPRPARRPARRPAPRGLPRARPAR